MTLNEIREDLRDIRYYYSRKDFLENGAKEISVVNSIKRRAEKYNAAMENAPPKLLDIYLNLYTKGYTQEATAAILGYSPQYINFLNNNLLIYLCGALSNSEKGSD